MDLDITFSSAPIMSGFEFIVELGGSAEAHCDAVVLPDIGVIENFYGSSTTGEMLRLSYSSENVLGWLSREDWTA